MLISYVSSHNCRACSPPARQERLGTGEHQETERLVNGTLLSRAAAELSNSTRYPLLQRRRLRRFPDLPQEFRQVFYIVERLGMRRAVGCLVDRQRATVEPFGAHPVAFGTPAEGQNHRHRGHAWILRSEGLLEHSLGMIR